MRIFKSVVCTLALILSAHAAHAAKAGCRTEAEFENTVRKSLRAMVGKIVDPNGSKVISIDNLILHTSGNGDDEATTTEYYALMNYDQTDNVLNKKGEFMDQTQWHLIGYVRMEKGTCKVLARAALGSDKINYSKP